MQLHQRNLHPFDNPKQVKDFFQKIIQHLQRTDFNFKCIDEELIEGATREIECGQLSEESEYLAWLLNKKAGKWIRVENPEARKLMYKFGAVVELARAA